jgi:hypothetical protein
MMRITGVLLCLLFMCKIQAQQVYFIYIQSEDRKPFYAKMNNRVISSTANGYLLVPKLQNGGHRLAIGFPGNRDVPEEEFLFTVDNADQGYDLKTTPSGNGHMLFNLLNYKMEYPVNGTGVASGKDTGTGNDFAGILADVVKDPSVKNTDPVKSPVQAEKLPVKVELGTKPDTVPVKKPDPIPIVKKDTLVENNVTPEKVIIETKPLAPTGKLERLFNRIGKEGTELVYADNTNGNSDTIRIFLPRLSTDMVETTPVKETILGTTVYVTSDTGKPATKNDGKFLDIEVKNPNKDVIPPSLGDTVVPEKKPADTLVTVPKLVMVNTDCKKIADEGDFLKLRKKMAGEKSNYDMMAVAAKVFRQSCFTVEQVKNLSLLFLDDDGKYRFYDLAYPFVYDTDKFAGLEQELKDEFYKNRFRALIRK